MSYSWHITGERIRNNREELTLSQEELSQRIEVIIGSPIKRQTVSGWENGKPIKKLEQLKALCEIFNCDTAYLLCECDTKRITSQSISDSTGLSKKAVDNLVTALRNSDPCVEIVSDLLEDMTVLSHISNFTTADYGRISTFVEIPDPFAPKGKQPTLISPKMIRTGDKMQVYKVICDFIDKKRRQNGLSAFDDL
ncbi:MAG: helix-turn-helix domain-containing protein [Suipraeoptans sp.]